MSRAAVALADVVAGLAADGVIDAAKADDGTALIEQRRLAPPWYVRLMVGVGAWLASLMLIGFVGGFGIAVGGSTFLGLALIAGAVFLRRNVTGQNDFAVQFALAVSLAGQALFAWGLADLVADNEFETGCMIVIVTSSILFFVFPDRVHRVLMVLFTITALVALIYSFELEIAVPLVGPLLAAAFVWIDYRRAALIGGGHGELLRPLESGLLLGAFGCLLLSAIYVLPELGGDFRFYPRPWISTLLLGALLLAVGGAAFARRLGERHARLPIVIALLAATVAAAWSMPGLLLALVVVLTGAANGNRTAAMVGCGFFAVFLTAWFYGIEVTLLVKSITLATTGVVILGARWLLLAWVLPEPSRG